VGLEAAREAAIPLRYNPVLRPILDDGLLGCVVVGMEFDLKIFELVSCGGRGGEDGPG
jgi:hypothetical protein